MDGGLICLLVVVGIVALFIYMSNQKSVNKYRAVCGECGFRSGWMTESQAEASSAQHYRSRHPNVPPGGTMQIRTR
ncbi:hypothetical protein [Nocardia sp. NPDC004722]